MIGHDDTNYGAGFNLRANPTQVSAWVSTSNTFVNSLMAYDVAGNVLSVQDPNGNTTRLSYADSYADGQNRNSYAHPTSVTQVVNSGLSNGQPQNGQVQTCFQNYTPYDRGTVFESLDGTSLKFVANSDVIDGGGFPGGTLITREGTRYSFSPDTYVSQIEDRNGNLINFSFSSTYSGGIYTVNDPVGRTETINLTEDLNSNTQDVISYPGSYGTPRTVTVNYAQLSNALIQGESVQSYHCLFPELNGSSSSSNFNPYVISSVGLPDGTSYTIRYNVYGEPARLTLPTGGVYTYSYPEAGCATWSGSGVVQINSGTDFTINRRVTERDEYADGTNLSGKATFSIGPGPIDTEHNSRPVTQATVSFQDQNAAILRTENHYFYGNPAPTTAPPSDPTTFADWWLGLEPRTEVADGGGTQYQVQLRTFSQQAIQSGEPNPNWYEPSSETAPSHNTQLTTLRAVVDGIWGSSIDFAYDPYNNLSEKYEYDWNSTTVLRRTEIVYETGGYIDQHLLGLPHQVTIHGGNGSILSDTVYGHDGYNDANTPIYNAPNIIGHDNQTYGGGGLRGNVTATSRWLNTNGWWVYSYQAYDIAGNPTLATDANGHQTYVSYADNYSDGQNHNSYAYPTTVTNAAGQSQYSQYDYSSGLPVAVSNLNGAYTILGYGDPLNRLTSVARPDGGNSNIYYENPTWTVYCQDKNSPNDCGYTSQSFSDGLGRSIEQRTFEDGSNYISTHTTYDALGRVQTQTNPSRVTNGNPDGLGFQTTYTYDAAGRTTKVQTADGSSTNTSYNGAITTVSDQANHQKAYGFDGIGRLAWVQEDPNGLSYMTNYIRDALDNITQVNQGDCNAGCQQRFFAFDSFSRLTTATNPESGLTSYEYDLAGNVTKKTDARGVATSLSYDALNRLTGKTYSTGMPSTLYVYDDSAISNSIGQLTKAASAYGVTNYTGFDAMGRVLGSNQLIGPSTFSFNYTYDLAGDLLSETYPTGRTLWNGYDGAGRVSYVRGSSPGGQWTTYANVYSYWPHGAPYYFGYGNNVVPVYYYNNRLQLNGAWATINNDANRFLGIWALNWGSNTNNGNLLTRGEYYGDAVPQGQLGTFSQSYGYDSLNRLAWASDNGGWSRNYAYDKTGNGWVTANNGVPEMGNTPTSNVYNIRNQISGASYDAAGNQLSANGDSLLYDAEGRMAVATEPVYLGGGTESFVYDALGQRTEKSSPSETFVYAYDAFGALAVKYAPWNTVLQEYVRMGGQLIATENSNNSSPCQTCYFVWDHLGSTRLVTDQNANVVARHDYLPFGEEIPGGWAGRSSEWGATNDTNEKFTGQLRDLETGLDYFHARYLSSSLGRFTSADPANAGANPYDPQSWNAYSYARNNPLALVDPSGMSGIASGSGDDGGCEDDPFCSWGDYPPPPPSDLPQPPPPPVTVEEPLPRHSFPGGETLGLPPGMRLPGPFGVNMPDPFVFSVCSASDPNCTVSGQGQTVGPTTGAITFSGILAVIYGLAGPAVNVSWAPTKKLLCIGGGFGVSAGHTLSGGPVAVHAKQGNTIQGVLGGWSLSGGYNWSVFTGAQGSINGSGGTAGYSIGIPGFSGTATYSSCHVFERR